MYEYPRVGCSKDVGQLWKKHNHRTLQNVTALAPEEIETLSGAVGVECTILPGCRHILEPDHLKSYTNKKNFKMYT